MAKSATISMRIDEDLKTDAETIFRQLGLSTTEAIKIFLSAVRNTKGLPFVLQLNEVQKAGALSGVAKRKQALDSIIGTFSCMASSEDFAQRKQQEIDLDARRLCK